MIIDEPVVDVPHEVALRKYQRQKRSTTSDDYLVYLHESKLDLANDNDPVSFSQVIESNNSNRWINAIKDELKSMKKNEVWDSIELPEGWKIFGC